MPRINSRHFLLNELLEVNLKSYRNGINFLNRISSKIPKRRFGKAF